MIEYLNSLMDSEILTTSRINFLPIPPEDLNITDKDGFNALIIKICSSTKYSQQQLKFLIDIIKDCKIKFNLDDSVFNTLFSELLHKITTYSEIKFDFILSFKFTLKESSLSLINRKYYDILFKKLFDEKIKSSEMWKTTILNQKWKLFGYFDYKNIRDDINQFLSEDKYSSVSKFLDENENLNCKIIYLLYGEAIASSSLISSYLSKNTITKANLLKGYIISEFFFDLECYSTDELMYQFIKDMNSEYYNYNKDRSSERSDDYTDFLREIAKNKKRWKELFYFLSLPSKGENNPLILEKFTKKEYSMSLKRYPHDKIDLFIHWKYLIYEEITLLEECLSSLSIGEYSLIIQEIKKLKVPESIIGELLQDVEKRLTPSLKENAESLPILMLREVVLNETLRIYRLRL